MSETATAAAPADAEAKAPDAAETAPEAVQDAPNDATDTDAPVDGEDALGDAGKKALDRMKADLKAAKAEAREAREAADRAKAAAEGREAEWEAERKAEKDRESKFRAKYLKAEIRGAAKGVLNDPEDAFRYLDLDEFDVSDDGEVDTAAITAALTDLTAKKPYLSAQGGDKKQVLPDVSQGASSSGKATSAELFAAAVKDRI